jgi:hypothetical protein
VANNIGQFIRAHRITVVAILSSLAIGFAIGFVATAAYHLQTTALIIFAVVAAIVSWLGSGTDILGLLRDMYKDWKSEQSVPVLRFSGYSKGRETANVDGKYVYNYTYFAIVKKISGKALAKDCEGFLTVAGTKISNAPTVWSHASVRRYNIGGRMDLRLFTVEGQNIIVFLLPIYKKASRQILNHMTNLLTRISLSNSMQIMGLRLRLRPRKYAK